MCSKKGEVKKEEKEEETDLLQEENVV